MTKPVVLQLGEYPAWDEERLAEAFELIQLYKADDRDALLDDVSDRVAAIASKGEIVIDGDLYDRFPLLRLIAVYGVGYDGVDVAAATARDIKVTNTPDVLTEDVADLALGLLIAQRRAIVGMDNWMRGGGWGGKDGYPLQRPVHGLRAGVLGLGRIGEAIARRCAAFGMPISYHARSSKPAADAKGWTYADSPEALATGCDVLFVALAASPATKDIVNADVLKALGREGLVVNISRGSNIDEAALLDALEDGTIGGAGLDVFHNEPTIDPRFFALRNVVLTPHAGSATVETRQAMGKLVFDNLAAHFSGNPLLTPVN